MVSEIVPGREFPSPEWWKLRPKGPVHQRIGEAGPRRSQPFSVEQPVHAQVSHGRGQSLDYQYNWWVQGGTGWPTAGPTSPADAASFMITVPDPTAPEVAYSGNAGSYDVSDDVAITCSATDATSGIATDDCADISGPAWGFSLGTNTFSATAMDNAGHSGSASGSFEVTVSFEGICAMVTGFVENRGVSNSMCAKLRGAEKAKNPNTRDNHLNAFMNEVAAQTGKKLTAAQAAALMALAAALQS